MRRLLVCALLVVVAATGCNGKKSNTASTSSTSPTASSSAAPSDLPTSAASVIAGLTTAQCQAIAKDFSTASSIFSSSDSSTPYSERFGGVSTAFSRAADDIDKPEVKAAMKTLARIYGEVADGLKGVTYKPGSGGAPPAAYLAAIKHFSDPGLLSASRTMSAYFAGGCH